jgi:hypothetical protein
MHKYFVGLIALMFTGHLLADELSFDFSQTPTNQAPSNCVSIVGGEGRPGTWRVIMDDVPLALAPLNPNAPTTAPKSVVAQLSWDAADNRYPMLELTTNIFGNFKVTTRFKIADGLTEQIAGLAFRMQDERNYFYVQASALGNTFYFYRVFKGVKSPPIGNNIKFTRNVWHDLSVECTGPKIHILLDGKEALPTLTDPTFSAGKIALLTKSDSISYFTDTRITYTPRETFAQSMVRDAMRENRQLVAVKIYMSTPSSQEIHAVASNDEKEIGQPGEKFDTDVISRGVNYFSKDNDKETVTVTLPLRDKNGDAVASVRLVMKSFKGQTEENALVRAQPILHKLQERASSVDNLF